MELKDALYSMMERSQAAQQPTDLVLGTVLSAAPLQVSISTEMAPLEESVLYRTSAVVERKIPVLSHTHTVTGLGHTHSESEGTTGEALSGTYTTSAALENIACLENGAALPVAGGYITLNRGLLAGDKVLLLRVNHGQKFVILSRLY